jgi:phage shock protein A
MGLSKLWTAIKGGANEASEAIEDSQAFRILDQEMREAKEALRKSNASLVTIMGKKTRQEDKVKALEADIEKYSNFALDAEEKGNDDLAVECAEKVGELEQTHETENAILQEFVNSVNSLKANIKKAETTIRRTTQQIEQAKATEEVQKAQTMVSSNHLGSNDKVSTALDSLDRIKDRQAQKGAELKAAQELADEASGSDLEAKLKKAGVAPGGAKSGSAKLEELRAKRKAKAAKAAG